MDEIKKQLLVSNIKILDSTKKIAREVLDMHEKVRERAINYTYKLITVIGIIAGFGFTATSYIKNAAEFIFGELLLFATIVVGMWSVKKIFIDESAYYRDYLDKLTKVMKERMQILPNKSIEEIQQKMEEIENNSLSIFDNKPKNFNVDFLMIVIFLFTGGGILLLISFVNLEKLLDYLSFYLLHYGA